MHNIQKRKKAETFDSFSVLPFFINFDHAVPENIHTPPSPMDRVGISRGGLKLNKWTFQRVGGNLEQNSSVEGYKYFLELHIIFCLQNLQMNVHQPGPPLW